MFIIRGKYFVKAKLILIVGPSFTLTIKRVHSTGAVAGALCNHGYRLRNERWKRCGDICYAQLTRISKAK